MNKRIYERIFLSATLSELFNGRDPDFRGTAAVRKLKRIGIEASCKNLENKFVRVTATATTEKHVTYLEIRGYTLTKPKRKKAAKPPPPSYPDVIQTILARPKTGPGGGIPLTRGEVAMLFLDGHAGDHPTLLDIRSLGYADDNLWHGLTAEDVLQDSDTAFVWEKWEPLELWLG